MVFTATSNTVKQVLDRALHMADTTANRHAIEHRCAMRAWPVACQRYIHLSKIAGAVWKATAQAYGTEGIA